MGAQASPDARNYTYSSAKLITHHFEHSQASPGAQNPFTKKPWNAGQGARQDKLSMPNFQTVCPTSRHAVWSSDMPHTRTAKTSVTRLYASSLIFRQDMQWARMYILLCRSFYSNFFAVHAFALSWVESQAFSLIFAIIFKLVGASGPCHEILVVKNPMTRFFSCCSVLFQTQSCHRSSLHPFDRLQAATAGWESL